jgi:tripartite-type tricarboxylate transporter receptor subunit TctC
MKAKAGDTKRLLAAGAGLVFAWSAAGMASEPASLGQGYPTKAIRMIVPFGTGSTTDTLARIVGQKFTEAWGQPVVIDNRGGAGGNIGTEMVAKAAGDGYTLLMAAGSHAINPSLYGNLPYDAVRDFAPVTLIGSAPQLLIASAGLPANSMRELIALAAAKPGQLRYASGGNGSPSHLAMELFKNMARVDMVHVPYKGGDPVLVALLSGEMHLYFGNIRAMMPHVRAGKLKALAVTSPKRSPAVPEIPTIAESGLPGYSMMAWWGLLAPAGTPKVIVTRLQAQVARMLKEPALRDRLAVVGIDSVGSSPEKFGAYIRQEIKTWSKVVKEAGVRID